MSTIFCCFEIINKCWFLSLEVGGGGVRMYLTPMPRRYSSQFLWVILRTVIYASCIGSTLQYYNVNVAVADPIKLLRPPSLSMYVRAYHKSCTSCERGQQSLDTSTTTCWAWYWVQQCNRGHVLCGLAEDVPFAVSRALPHNWPPNITRVKVLYARHPKVEGMQSSTLLGNFPSIGAYVFQVCIQLPSTDNSFLLLKRHGASRYPWGPTVAGWLLQDIAQNIDCPNIRM